MYMFYDVRPSTLLLKQVEAALQLEIFKLQIKAIFFLLKKKNPQKMGICNLRILEVITSNQCFCSFIPGKKLTLFTSQ